MPFLQKKITINAGAQHDNILTGSQWEFLPFHAQVNLALNGSAAGLVADIYTGTDTLAEDMHVNAANRYPVNPDDYQLADIAAAGERLKVRVRNPTGGNLDLYYGIIITPMAV